MSQIGHLWRGCVSSVIITIVVTIVVTLPNVLNTPPLSRMRLFSDNNDSSSNSGDTAQCPKYATSVEDAVFSDNNDSSKLLDSFAATKDAAELFGKHQKSVAKVSLAEHIRGGAHEPAETMQHACSWYSFVYVLERLPPSVRC